MNLIDLHIKGDPVATWLRPPLLSLLQLLRISSVQWSITLVRDRDMKALHAQTMNVPTTTDVLTFDLRDPPSRKSRPHKDREGSPVELDTVICLDEARRRAKELAHPIRHELLLYCLHSLLHVQGYKDLTSKDAAAMHAREDALLVALGVGPVYGGDTGKRRAPGRGKTGSQRNHGSAEGTKVKRSRPR